MCANENCVFGAAGERTTFWTIEMIQTEENSPFDATNGIAQDF
jgi:hypothetical protein